MRKALKFLHTLAACGMIGALLGYGVILLASPQDTPLAYAHARAAIKALCDYILLPSLAIALISGLLAMAVHRPFQEMRWVWIKALLGIGTFEGTLVIIQAKASNAAAVAASIAAGEAGPDALARALTNEWGSLAVIMALSVANVVLGVWRPRLAKRPQPATA